MIIKSIKLDNFRCHKEYFLEFNKKTTMIVGENGCGKTSVLEGIYIGCQGKSFRATDKEIIKEGEGFYRCEVELYNGEKITVIFDGRKKVLIQDKSFGRMPKKYKIPVVVFDPSDLNLISTSPTKRRNYFDKFFSQISEKYYNSLLKYNKALKQRNELLKKEFLRSEEVFSWNVMLAKYGTEISEFRKKMSERINTVITDVYRGIAENGDTIQYMYATHTEGGEGEYLKKIEEGFLQDRAVGTTGFGIQRDDYRFYFNKKEADGTASRGEIRSIILALKFIEANILKEENKKEPLILLDDVFSELDEKRQKCLSKNFKDNQVIITSVGEV